MLLLKTEVVSTQKPPLPIFALSFFRFRRILELPGNTLMRTFTLDEAQPLLPVLESLLKRAIEGRRSAQEVESGLNGLAQRIYFSGGMRVNTEDIAKQRAEMEGQLKRVRESIAEIDAIGVQVKDLEAGLLDFPCRVDDQVVLLCWRMGEPAIEHWHTIEAGFKGRQPVDERFRRRTSSDGRTN
jgi:hypothetical protein